MGETDKRSPDADFASNIPAAMHDEIMTAISEAAHIGCGKHGCVTILDQDRIDAINVRAEGIVNIGEREYWFIVRDGNRDGTVLEAWEGTGTQAFEPSPRTHWALAPKPELVSDAIQAQRGQFLLMKWDVILQRPGVARIPGNYTYDRMMQPGLVIEDHYRKEAARHGLILTDQEHATHIRARLAAATVDAADTARHTEWSDAQ